MPKDLQSLDNEALPILRLGLMEVVESLRQLRGNEVIVFCVDSLRPKALNDADIIVLYECLRQLGPVDVIDLVLNVDGGSINAARRFAHLLREFTSTVNILIPSKARSAGTLLCLSANQLILGPLAELSPIDPFIASSGERPSGSMPAISSEEIRGFLHLADKWFKLSTHRDRREALNILARHIFPTTLASFYRASILTRQIGNELLIWQLPKISNKKRQKIINKLIEGYSSHEFALTRDEVINIGLNARCASFDEEAALWKILKSSNLLIQELTLTVDQDRRQQTKAILLSQHTMHYFIGGWQLWE